MAGLSWGDTFGEDHLNPTANCSQGECGFFRITRDYTDAQTNVSHWSCQMNWHALAAMPERPGSCSACQSAAHPDDTDYCKCYEASQGHTVGTVIIIDILYTTPHHTTSHHIAHAFTTSARAKTQTGSGQTAANSRKKRHA